MKKLIKQQIFFKTKYKPLKPIKFYGKQFVEIYKKDENLKKYISTNTEKQHLISILHICFQIGALLNQPIISLTYFLYALTGFGANVYAKALIRRWSLHIVDRVQISKNFEQIKIIPSYIDYTGKQKEIILDGNKTKFQYLRNSYENFVEIRDKTIKKSSTDKVSFYIIYLQHNQLDIYNDYFQEKIKGKEIVFKQNQLKLKIIFFN